MFQLIQVLADLNGHNIQANLAQQLGDLDLATQPSQGLGLRLKPSNFNR